MQTTAQHIPRAQRHATVRVNLTIQHSCKIVCFHGTSHAPRRAAASPRPEGHLLRHRAFTSLTALTPSKEASPSHLPKPSPDTSSGDDRVAAGGAVSSASATSPPSAPSPGASLAPEVELPWPAPRSWAEVALGKLLDTVEDVGVIARRTLSERLPGAELVDRLFRPDGAGRLRLVPAGSKPVLLVLGTGWAAHALVKVIDVEAYEVVVVSPRNHFLFTPMLPSTAVGTVEFRSLLEPIRTSNPYATYLEASCDSLDPHAKVAYCTAAVSYDDGSRPSFAIPYDVAVIAVGEAPATYGVPGVAEHCYFVKEVADCVGLRKRIQEVFELAALPGTSDEARRRVLHFAVVGGGPTGVEFAGTLRDFVRGDLARKYPELMPFVRVTLLQSAQSILTQFSASLQARALSNFADSGVDVLLGVSVTAVRQGELDLAYKDGRPGTTLQYGLCVWSTGNAARPLTRSLVADLPRQAALNAGSRPAGAKLVVDPFLRVVGAADLLAMGDCAALAGQRLPATAQVAAQQGAYAARLLNRGYSLGRGGLDAAPPLRLVGPTTAAQLPEGGMEALRTLRPVDGAALLPPSGRLGELELAALISGDSSWLAPPGVEYYRKPFEFLSLGLLAYVGNDRALTQVEAFDASVGLYGRLAFLLWRSVYLTKQVSLRNRVLILFDWLKAQVFGRDLSQF